MLILHQVKYKNKATRRINPHDRIPNNNRIWAYIDRVNALSITIGETYPRLTDLAIFIKPFPIQSHPEWGYRYYLSAEYPVFVYELLQPHQDKSEIDGILFSARTVKR